MRSAGPTCRTAVPVLALAAFLLIGTGLPAAADETSWLVLPFRSLGVSDTTLQVTHHLLENELSARGLRMLPATDGLPSGADACDHPECASAAARARGADRVVYGSLSRSGPRSWCA